MKKSERIVADSPNQGKLTAPPAHARRAGAAGTVLRSLGLAILALALMGMSAAGTMYYQLQHNVQQHEIVRVAPEKKKDPEPVIPIDQKAGQPLNILLLGSDERPADSKEKVEGMRADTTMLVHISANRDRIDVLSIPRDTLVHIPSCALPSGDTTWGQDDAMFNSAFMLGGSTGDVGAAASCTLATVEGIGNILIDGFAVVNFESFKAVVDSIGGVDMCFLTDVADPESELYLSAGCHTLYGHEALAIARARHSLGDGSDLSRIGRQQELVFQIIKKLFSLNLLSNTQTFYQVASDVTQNLDTSAGLGDLTFLAGLAYSLKNLDFENNVHFMTLPVHYDVKDPNRVRESPEATIVWDALRNDQPIPATALSNPLAQNEVVVENRQPKDPAVDGAAIDPATGTAPATDTPTPPSTPSD